MSLRDQHVSKPHKDGTKTTHSPNLYAEYTEWPRKVSLKVLDLLALALDDESDDNQNFLEIGCGPGDFTRNWLWPTCPPCRKIVAGDVSRDMLLYAKEHFSHPKIEYDFLDIEGDVSEFAAKHGHFRRIYSFFCLHWVKDLAGSLKNISKLMSPDGECLVVFIARHPFFPIRREIVSMEKWKAYKKVVEDAVPKTQDFPDRKTLKSFMLNLLQLADLKPETFEVLRIAKAPPQLDTLIEAELATDPVVPLLNEEDKLQYIEDVNRFYRSRWSAEDMDAPIDFPRDYIVFHARKGN